MMKKNKKNKNEEAGKEPNMMTDWNDEDEDGNGN